MKCVGKALIYLILSLAQISASKHDSALLQRAMNVDSIQNTSWEMTEGTQLRYLVHRLKSQHNTDLLIGKAHKLFQKNNGAGNR